MFTLNPMANANATGYRGEITAAPLALRFAFGEPESFDEYKISGAYTFEGPNGEVFTLYDYKATSLYAPGRPTPADLWASLAPVSFHIGGRTDAAQFIAWLEEVLAQA